MMCMALILVCSVSISTFAVDRMSQVESGTTQSVQKTDNQNGEAATTRQKSSEAETKTKQENTKKSDSESKTKENKDSSEEKQSDSKDVNDKGAKENSTQKEEKEKKEKSEKDTSKEEKSTKEETDTDKKTTDTTDASEATTKTAEEEKTESAEEKTTEAATEKTTESKNGEEETSEKKAEEETQAADAKRQKIQVAEITGPTEVQVGKTITLTGTSGYSGYYYTSNHKWTSSNTNTATIDGSSNKSTVTVRGINTGTVTIKHSYSLSTYWGSSEQEEESYTVNVVRASNETAAIYFLATPDGVPESNDIKYWAPKSDTSTLFGKINTTGATWEGNKNITNNVSSYVVSWPDSSTATNWVINKGADNFNYILNNIWTDYKSTIEKQLEVTGLSKTDVTQITLTPFKISKDNSPTINQNYHIDCTIDVKCKNVFTAKFWVKDPNSDYKLVDAKNYVTESKVAKTEKAIIGSTKTVNGVTYVLDGWYPESETGGAYGSPKIVDDRWSSYKPSDTELADGTVNFYAHYSPKITSIILKKLVTGSMGDKQKEFTFNISVEKDNESVLFKVGNESKTGSATVNLANNDEKILTEIPVGANVTITESDYSGSRYTTSYTVDDNETVKNRVVSIASIQAKEDVSEHQVVFTNNKEAIPDTGIASDVLPFITLFALSIAGIIGFLLYSYKKRFV